MQELRQEASQRRIEKSKVGTIYCDQINFSKHIPAFDSNNMPLRARGIRSDVKLSVQSDILGVNPSKWNPSVLLDKTKEYHQQVSTPQLHLEIRKGLRDISNPLPSHPKLYEGVDTRNRYTGWNVSVEYSSKEHKDNHFKVNLKARNNSAQRAREILSNKPYTKPFERQVIILSQARNSKENDLNEKNEILKNVLHQHPDISREKASALVQKILKERKEKDKQEEFYGVVEERFKPDTSATGKKNFVKKTRHDGIFGFNHALDRMIWSCCASEDPHDRGCVVTLKDKDKWQLVSF
jgi:hypothetical protein